MTHANISFVIRVSNFEFDSSFEFRHSNLPPSPVTLPPLAAPVAAANLLLPHSKKGFLAMAKFKSAADIKVGVIGYGGAFNMGKHHLNEMLGAGMTPTAVCEVDPKRLEVAKTDFANIQTYGSVAEMLKKSDVDLVTIITPHNTHAPLALQCLKAGRSVITEKPFAITTAECDAMIKAAKAKKVLLSIYHNRHWDGCVLKAMEIIKSGAIGEVFRIEMNMGGYGKPGDWWRSSKSISGGILYDWGAHLIEYSLQMIGDSEISEVSGFAHEGYWAPQTAWKNDGNEDEGFAVVRFKNKKWITLRITSLDSGPTPRMAKVNGTLGSLNFDHGSYEIIKPGADGKTSVERGNNPPGQSQEYYKNVAASLTGSADLIITAEWGRRPIHILDLAVQSAKKGKSLPSKYS